MYSTCDCLLHIYQVLREKMQSTDDSIKTLSDQMENLMQRTSAIGRDSLKHDYRSVVDRLHGVNIELAEKTTALGSALDKWAEFESSLNDCTAGLESVSQQLRSATEQASDLESKQNQVAKVKVRQT